MLHLFLGWQREDGKVRNKWEGSEKGTEGIGDWKADKDHLTQFCSRSIAIGRLVACEEDGG